MKILSLGPKEFLTGISSSAHLERGGIFFKADGITPLYDAAGNQSVENGLLQPGPSPTDFTGSVIVDVPMAAYSTSYTGTAFAYFLGTSGHFYKKAVGSGNPTDLRDGTTAYNNAFTADKTAATDIITPTSTTVSAMGLINGMTVKYTAVDHGGLIQNTTYYVGAISGNTFKLYTDSGLTSLVDITADGGNVPFEHLGTTTVITSPANGITVWGPAGGTPKLYYWQQAYIGTWNMSGTFPVGWTDQAYTISQGNNSTYHKPVHKFVGNVYYGNGDRIGALQDDGSQGVTHNSNVLDIPTREGVTSISDDGQYLVFASTENVTGASVLTRCKIYFWDTFSPSWTREFIINEAYIYKIQNIGNGVLLGIGKFGIYEITFNGVKKLDARSTGFGTVADFTTGYGANRGINYGMGSLMYGTDSTVDVYGKLQPDVPFSYHKPFKVASGRVSLVHAELDSGRVYVGTTTPKLYAYDFNATTRETGNTAQTVYFPVDGRVEIDRIDLVFGEPLASGDAITPSILSDEDTTAVDFASATFALDAAVRRKKCKGSKVVVEDQFSVKLTFTTGAVKVKRVEIYGTPLDV